MVTAYSSCQLILICWSPKLCQWEGTLTPLPLTITPIALVTGICEQFHIWGTGPIYIMEEADPILAGQVGEPPLDVLAEFHLQLDAVMPSWRSLSSARGRLCQGTHPTNKMQFTNKGENLMLCG